MRRQADPSESFPPRTHHSNAAHVFGELAQLGERLVCNQEVTGSSPVFSTLITLQRPPAFALGGGPTPRLARESRRGLGLCAQRGFFAPPRRESRRGVRPLPSRIDAGETRRPGEGQTDPLETSRCGGYIRGRLVERLTLLAASPNEIGERLAAARGAPPAAGSLRAGGWQLQKSLFYN